MPEPARIRTGTGKCSSRNRTTTSSGPGSAARKHRCAETLGQRRCRRHAWIRRHRGVTGRSRHEWAALPSSGPRGPRRALSETNLGLIERPTEVHHPRVWCRKGRHFKGYAALRRCHGLSNDAPATVEQCSGTCVDLILGLRLERPKQMTIWSRCHMHRYRRIGPCLLVQFSVLWCR